MNTTTATPHYRDTVNADGTYNLSAIIRIAHARARADFSRGDDMGTYTYARCFASHLRTTWGVARTNRAALSWKAVA